jgi:hypothetical protein
MTNVQTLMAELATQSKQQKALEAQLATAIALVEAEQDAEKKKALEDEQAKVAAAAAESAEKVKTLKAQAMAHVQAAKDAEANVAQGPMYPQGLVVKFGKRTATIARAVKNGHGEWFYTIDLLAGELLELGDGMYELTESEMRTKVQEEVGAVQPGQAFAAGMSVSRHGVGGLVERVSRDASGQFAYQLQGWPRVVSQAELLGILTRS